MGDPLLPFQSCSGCVLVLQEISEIAFYQITDAVQHFIAAERKRIRFIQGEQIERLIVPVQLMPLLYCLHAILRHHCSTQGSMPFCVCGLL